MKSFAVARLYACLSVGCLICASVAAVLGDWSACDSWLVGAVILGLVSQREARRVRRARRRISFDNSAFLAAELDRTKDRYAKGEIDLDEFEWEAARTVRYQQNDLERRMA